ncbi:MAG: pyridoxamine 5'-phosphate oxidase [Candidatus Hydrogenedentota bacterium]
MDPELSSAIPDFENPYDLFDAWFKDAADCPDIKDVTAMTLATVDAEGQPWTRIVLLKDLTEKGFSFFTNLASIKGEQLADSNKVSLNFYWPALDRQIRIMGTTTPTSTEESDTYFAKRPRESQLGAWASMQSAELDARSTMIDRMEAVTKKYGGQDVPRPDFWGGYIVAPTIIEFWLSRPHRLHDRTMYTRAADGSWTKKGLYP